MPANGVKKLAGTKKHSVGEPVLSLFWDLASLDKAVVERASVNLYQKVSADQKSFLQNPGAQTTDKDESSNKQHAKLAEVFTQSSPLAVYTMRRLCQGLASSRKGARQGFATALSNLLEHADWIKPDQVVSAISILLSPPASAKKSEVKDALIGQLFGIGAVVRAYRKIDVNAAIKLGKMLVQISRKRAFLRQAASSLLLDLTDKIKDSELNKLLNEVEGFKAMLTTPVDKATPEELYLVLQLWGRLPADIRTSCPLLPHSGNVPNVTSNLWKQDALQYSEEFQAAAAAVLNEDHITTLLPVLHGTTSSHPKIHLAWNTLLSLLIPGYYSKRSKNVNGSVEGPAMKVDQLKALWTVAVEKDIFSSTSHERRFLGLMLFREILPFARPEHVKVLFSPAFLKTLENNLSQKSYYLHASAKKCMESIQAVMAKGDESMATAIATEVQKVEGSALKELCKGVVPVVKPKKQTEVANLSSDEINTHVKKLCLDFVKSAKNLKDEDSSDEAKHEINTIVNQLGAVAKKPDTTRNTKTSILDFLAAYAFGPEEQPSAKDQKLLSKHGVSNYVVLLPSLRELCRSRVIALADGLSKTPPPQKGDGVKTTQSEDKPDYLLHVAEFVGQLRAQGVDGEDAKQRLAAWTLLFKTLEGAGSKASDTTTNHKVAALQHLVALMQLYVAADATLVDEDLVTDLEGVCKEAFGSAKPKAKKKTTDEEETPHYMDVLVDILLSLMARTYTPYPSAPARDAGERVFKAFCGELTKTGLADLLGILTRPLDVGGGGNEEDAEEMDVEEEEENSSGEEEESDEEAEAMEEDSGSEDQEDDDEEASEDDKDDDEDDDDDDAATDQQMFQLDDKLGAYFAAMRVDRSSRKTQRQEEINFKLRTVAWLEAFIKKVPDSSLLPSTVDPLLTALTIAARSGGDKVLMERLSGVIQHRLCKSKAEASGAALDDGDELIKNNLHRALYLASRAEDKMVATVAWASYIYMQRVALGSSGNADEVPAVALESLQVSLQDFFEKKKTRLSHKELSDLLRRVPTLALVAMEGLVKQAASGRNEYVRLEAFALLEVALQSVRASIAKIATELSESLGEMLTVAVNGQFSKAPKQIQAIKACCQLATALNSYCGGASAILPASVVAAVSGAKSDNAKVQGQLARLQTLVAVQKKGGKAPKNPAKGKAAAAAAAPKRSAPSPRVTRAKGAAAKKQKQ